MYYLDEYRYVLSQSFLSRDSWRRGGGGSPACDDSLDSTSTGVCQIIIVSVILHRYRDLSRDWRAPRRRESRPESDYAVG